MSRNEGVSKKDNSIEGEGIVNWTDMNVSCLGNLGDMFGERKVN